MKVLQINTVYGQGSTGKIAMELHDLCVEQGIECLSGCRSVPDKAMVDVLPISGDLDSRIHGILARFTMHKGCFSYGKTRRFLKRVEAYRPDVIHLHNLHGSYVNIGLLMKYVRKNQIPVVMTLHDCWAFTAICSHFSIAGCQRWKTGCGRCPQRRRYSSAPVDLTAQMYRRKKSWFSGISNLTVVTPSRWLAGLAQQSMLGCHPVHIIYNGIDLQIFRATESEVRKRYGLEHQKMVLAVAFGWGYGKGLDVVVELAKRLPADCRVVVVGADEDAKRILPEQVITIPRTNNQQELAQLYTAADVFINPTREEVLGLVNLEAIACGTPVVTFAAGGSPECIDETCGVAVPIDDVDAMEREILRICREHPYRMEDCIDRARQFDKHDRLREYLELYRRVGRNAQ